MSDTDNNLSYTQDNFRKYPGDFVLKVYQRSQDAQYAHDQHGKLKPTSNKRCGSTNPNGIQCGFPFGHIGKHGNGNGILPW